jgi:hypothetical protein
MWLELLTLVEREPLFYTYNTVDPRNTCVSLDALYKGKELADVISRQDIMLLSIYEISDIQGGNVFSSELPLRAGAHARAIYPVFSRLQAMFGSGHRLCRNAR